jgi:hypothetical protein
VAELGAYRLTLLDLLLVAGIAVASFWAGETTAALCADSIIGPPLPDISFQVKQRVTSDEDSMTSLEEQQKVISYQIAMTRTALDTQQVDLTYTSGSKAVALGNDISESTALLGELNKQRDTLSNTLDTSDLALAKDKYNAERSATRSSSLRGLGVWTVQAVGSMCALALLAVVVGLMRLRIRTGLHARAVLGGALAVLACFLATAYAGWLGLMLIVILLLSLTVVGSQNGNVRTR